MSQFKYRNKKILKHAEGQDCQMQIPGICNHNPETVVAAHSDAIEDGKGKGTKAHDHMTVFCCEACHAAYSDANRRPKWMSREEVQDYFYRGMRRTWTILLRDGILK